MARTALRACSSVIAGWIVLSACGLGTEGLGIGLPDDAATPEGSIDPARSDGPALADGTSFQGSAEDAEASPGYGTSETGTSETGNPVAEASDAIVNVGADATTAGSDAGDATSDSDVATASGNEASTDATNPNEAASEASGDVGVPPEASSGDSGASDAGSDANACVLPAGATMCCGSVACTDHGGSCTTPGICASCQLSCTPARPFCCALGGQTVKCEVRVIDC